MAPRPDTVTPALAGVHAESPAAATVEIPHGFQLSLE
jgi:hypothetical protein